MSFKSRTERMEDDGERLGRVIAEERDEAKQEVDEAGRKGRR